MSKNPLRWGIIGPGRIARKFADALTVVDDGFLYAVASRELERAKAFTNEFGASISYGSYEQIVEDPNVDVIYVATPHRYHYEHCLLALGAGKPVLCEKPLTVNATEAEELIKISRKKDVFLMEALWSRYLPVQQGVRRWLDEDRIGEVRFISSKFGIVANRDPQGRMFNAHLAGGALLDLGVYNLAISQWVLRKNPDSFWAQSVIGETNVDEVTGVSLRYDGGEISQFTCSITSETAHDMFIYGTRGHIRIYPKFWNTTQASLLVDGDETAVRDPFRKNGFEYQIEEAISCVREGLIESVHMSHADSLANMQLMDEIRQEINLKYPFE